MSETVSNGLVQQAILGDAAAFRQIYDEHAPSIRRYLGDLLRDPSAADEATQETFVRAHKKLAAVVAVDRLLPWLLGIARNVSFESRRSTSKHAKYHSTQLESDVVTALPDRSATPEQQMLGREVSREMDRALQLLAEPKRVALLLRIDHGLDYETIARQMGWSLGKVKTEIHRARRQLRAHLAPYLEMACE